MNCVSLRKRRLRLKNHKYRIDPHLGFEQARLSHIIFLHSKNDDSNNIIALYWPGSTRDIRCSNNTVLISFNVQAVCDQRQPKLSNDLVHLVRIDFGKFTSHPVFHSGRRRWLLRGRNAFCFANKFNFSHWRSYSDRLNPSHVLYLFSQCYQWRQYF